MLHYRTHSLDELANIWQVPITHAYNANHEDATWINNWRAHGCDASWYGGCSSEREIMNVLTRGWSDGANRVADIVRQIGDIPAARSRRRVGVWAEFGDELSVDRAMSGDWDNAWRTAHRVVSHGPVSVDLYALIGGNGECSAEDLFWAGASAVVITDLLEAAGYAVSLTAVSIARQYATNAITANAFPLKDTSEPVRTDAIASVLCHAGVFRANIFRARLTLDANIGDGKRLMGATGGWDSCERELRANGTIPDGAILLNHTYTRDACIAQIQRVLQVIQSDA